MDREKANAIRAALEPLFGGVERALSVKFKIGNISYDPAGGHASVKLEVADVRADGTVVSKEAEDFKRLAPVYGLPSDALGKSVVYAGKPMTIIGLPKCSRFPGMGLGMGLGQKYWRVEKQVKVKWVKIAG